VLWVHDQYGVVQPTKLPVWLPDSHVPLKEHQPQLLTAVHVLHVEWELQGSTVGAGVAGHVFWVHDQYGVVQPTKLPVWLPDSHVPLYEHQPQFATAVQLKQLEY
jgi:hypothetical protein